MADAVATNSNRLRDYSQYRDPAFTAGSIISKVSPKSNRIAPSGDDLCPNSESPKNTQKNSQQGLQAKFPERRRHMSRLFSIRSLMRPQERFIWAQVRIIHETDKAILVDNGRKFWIPKSRICGIRLKGNTFEIYVKESVVG